MSSGRKQCMWQIPMSLSGFKVSERVEVNKERDGFERPSEL